MMKLLEKIPMFVGRAAPRRAVAHLVHALTIAALLAAPLGAAHAAEEGPFHASGMKVGEVTDTSAIVWARLTLRPQRNPSDAPAVEIDYGSARPGGGRRTRKVLGVRFPEGLTVRDIREAVPGVDGDVRVLVRARGTEKWEPTDWASVDPLGDFTRQFTITDLKPATQYDVRIESRGIDGTAGATLDGEFRTAPRGDDPARVLFTAATCFGNDDQDCPEGFKIYEAMADLDPDFFVHAGDIIYYDQLAKNVDLARYHWQRMYSWPSAVAFHRKVASFFIKDDHDTWVNDCWPTMPSRHMLDFTFRQGQLIFLEQVPMGDLTYRTRRYGKDLQVWMVEGRDYRSANTMPDGPDKTIWGPVQKKWLKDTLAASDATFRVLFSPTPMVGPDRDSKLDNHANSGFKHEGDELRNFLAGQKNTIVICGDRHWQYMSIDPKTKLREYCTGPASDEHAGGWQQSDYREDYHRYLRVKGGFLAVTVDRSDDGTPTMTLRHHDVNGAVQHEDQLVADTAPAE